MVVDGIRLQASNFCDICGTRFKRGDQAKMIVALPGGDYVTVCLECWQAMLAIPTGFLKHVADGVPDALKSRLGRAIDLFSPKND